MAVIAIFNQKGGSGKTMLTVHLAVAAQRAGRNVAVLDLDPQGSAAQWHSIRGADSLPVVVKVPDSSLKVAVAGAQADGYDFILIDAPPSVSTATARIIAAADLVVIPVRPEPFDIAAVPDTVKLVGGRRYVFVLSDCPQRAPEIGEARAVLEQFGRPVFGPVNNWRSMWRALVSGKAVAEYEPDGLPAAEIHAVCESILKEIA